MERMIISTPREDEQFWTDRFLKEIKKKYNIIFDGHGCYAIRVIPRENANPLFAIMSEDDGALYETDVVFDAEWTDSFIKCLENAKEYCKKI